MRRVMLALILVVAAGCGGDAEDDDAEDRFGLEALDLPALEAEIAAVFAAMPDEVLGVPRTAGGPGEFAAVYGISGVVAIPFGTETSPEPETLVEDLSQFDLEPSSTLEASNLDPGAEVVWLLGSFSDGGGAGVVYIAVWGEPQGGWAFNASGDSVEMRNALVEAFVAAAGG
jgi:hypothetical protein